MNSLKIFYQSLQKSLQKKYFQPDQPSGSAPFLPILLYLEWLLLGFTALIFTLASFIASFPKLTITMLASVVLLGLMRYWLPHRNLTHKILFTSLEFGIVLLPNLIDLKLPPLPPLGIIIVMRSCQMFRLPGRLVVAGLTFFLFVNTIPSKTAIKDLSADAASSIMRLNATLSFGFALTFILLLINALLEERQSRVKLAAAHEQLRHYALRIEDQSALQERNRIAREIHDSLGHTLTAQSIQLDSALLLLQSNVEKAVPFLRTSKQLCTQALGEVRQSVGTLRLDLLQGKSLEAAIATLLKDFCNTTNLTVDSAIQINQPPSNEIKLSLYRILQEALTNITRHSEATTATIQLFEQEQTLFLLVRDNGKGFDPAQNSTGFGLQSMHERTTALNGRFTLLSQPGSGCLITAQIPLPAL